MHVCEPSFPKGLICMAKSENVVLFAGPIFECACGFCISVIVNQVTVADCPHCEHPIKVWPVNHHSTDDDAAE